MMTLTTASETGALSSSESDVPTYTSRRHATSRRRTSAGGAGDATVEANDERPRFVVGVDDDPPVTRRLSVRSRRNAGAARPFTPPPDRDPSTTDTETLDAGSQVVQSDSARTTDSPNADTTRRRMSAAERRRLKNELLSSSSLEIS